MASYKFTLRTPDNAIVFGTENIRNWKDIEPGLTENGTYKYLFREFTSTFEFTGFARQLIIETVDNYGYDAELFLTVEVGNDNKDRWSFEVAGNELKADLQEMEVGENHASLNFADSKYTAQIMDNHDKKIDVFLKESLNGVTIDKLATRDIRMHDRTLVFNSLYEFNEDYDVETATGGGIGDSYRKYIVIPQIYTFRNDENLKNLLLAIVSPTGNSLAQSAIYLQSEKTRDLKISISISSIMRFTSDFNTTFGYQIGFVHRNEIEDSYIWFQQSAYFGGSSPDLEAHQDVPTDLQININDEITITLNEGDSLEFVIDLRALGSFVIINFICSFIPDIYSLTFTSNEYYDATTSPGIFPYALFEKFTEIYTGQTGRFYSEFFGYKEIGYAEDGEGAFKMLMTGKMLRGFPLEDAQFVTSMKEMFEAFDCIYCLAGTIENIGGKERLRIEPYKDLLNNEVVMKLGEMLAEVERKANDKMIFSEIAIGYKDREYEEVNGLFDFNGESNFITPLQLEGTKLDIVCKWITGDIAIELTRRKQYVDNPTIDWRLDKEIFIVDCNILREYQNGAFVDIGFHLVPITNEGFDNITGIYEPLKAYNLNLSPKRNLLRWGWFISACLYAKSDAKIKFVKGPNNPNLITQKTGETEIVEAADILVSDLDRPLFLPDKFTIAEAELTQEQWDAINNNKGGLIEFQNKGIRLFGRIAEITFAIDRKTANFELNRANY
jgi:hypothetical protein